MIHIKQTSKHLELLCILINLIQSSHSSLPICFVFFLHFHIKPPLAIIYTYKRMSGVAKYYAKMFGAGAAMGAGLEVLLIKSNYCKLVVSNIHVQLCSQCQCVDQMLAASEAKQRLKDLKQEQEDLERYNRMQQNQQASSSSPNQMKFVLVSFSLY